MTAVQELADPTAGPLCGTASGAGWHSRHMQRSCEPCLAAKRAYRREHYARNGSRRRHEVYVATVKPMLDAAPPADLMLRTDLACRRPGLQPDLFFPEDVASGQPREFLIEWAKRLCRGCPARVACLQGALARREQHGIWGGLTAPERRRLLS